eukprot:CAMPEP_0201489164 /NCGR_PEP_ID=MMETSP0151_2-20130828/21058_1 /ASSEMBLY_ACC=CAM_ASM_000257 /TAXON_ID=200890 /ORGANISM="Paramoeba atlantica, Strain 621/1 / CCAP 1560/9" /LENGTH=444 /DNA_ID=CAMNT_0047874655 /DNA_START=140 /DNA_END=1474 /DNA_ORIENTATION=+
MSSWSSRSNQLAIRVAPCSLFPSSTSYSPLVSSPLVSSPFSTLRNERTPVQSFVFPQKPLFYPRFFADGGILEVEIPQLGDSVTEGTVEKWVKGPGDYVAMDEVVGTIETDKATQEIRAPEAGVIEETYVEEGETVHVGSKFFRLKLGGSQEAPKPKSETPPPPTPTPTPSQPQAPPPPPPPPVSAPRPPTPPTSAPRAPTPPASSGPLPPGVRSERRVKMSRMRLKISERLKDAQNVNAMLTTFNEVDMGNLMELRTQYKDAFEKRHGVKLGFMSAFVKAATLALQEQPTVNAVIDGDEILYRDYIDVSVAVAAPKGLVVPVLRNCENLSFADIEHQIGEYGQKARDGKLSIEEMTGGTFTISNGGVFGSLMGTPIINPPQSAILGMHATNKRPVVRNDQIVIRPMMYLALTYDHRLIDGREAVTFLKKVRDLIQDPQAMLLE